MNHHETHKEFDNLKEFKVFNVDHEWDQFMNKVDVKNEDGSEAPILTSKETAASAKVFRLPRYAAAIAAGLLILIVSTLAFLNLQQEEVQTIVQQPKIQTEEIEDEIEVVAEKEIADVVEVTEKPSVPVVVKETPKPTVVAQTYEPIVYEPAPEVKTVEPTLEVKTVEPAPVQDLAEALPVEEPDVFRTYLADESIILDDGTVVTFQETSTIKVSSDFKSNSERNVNFDSGNAIFDVASMPEKPFKIVTDNSGVTILGTSFEMIKDGIFTSIETFEGKVKLFSLADAAIETVVSKGQSFKFDGEKITQIIEEVQELVKPEEDLEKGTYTLKSLSISWSAYYSDNVVFKTKAIDKSLLDEPFQFPKEFVATGPSENITKGLALLQELFNVDFESKENCEHCYKINSISPKS